MWYSEIMRMGSGNDGQIDPENKDDYHSITLSEDAELTYFYLDDDGGWQEQDELENEDGKQEVPEALSITFESDYADSQIVYLYLNQALPTGPEVEPCTNEGYAPKQFQGLGFGIYAMYYSLVGYFCPSVDGEKSR